MRTEGAFADGQGLLSELPPPGVAGRMFWTLDTHQWLRDDGRRWWIVAEGVPYP